MFKFFIKKFSDKNKLDEARKKAMETYEKLISENKININRDLENELIDRKETSEKLDDYKSNEAKKRVENLVSNFEYVKAEKPKFENIASRAKIKNGILYYTLSDFNKRNYFYEKDWMTIYELNIDNTFENFKRVVKLILLGILTYNTYLLLANKKKRWLFSKHFILSPKAEKYYQYTKYSLLYLGLTGLFIIDRSYNKRNIAKIQLNKQNLEIIRIALQSSPNKFIETDIANMFSINSKRKTHHEIMVYTGTKLLQLFASKNARYDQEFLINICHKDVRKIKFTNINY
jgi:hypothetical protein